MDVKISLRQARISAGLDRRQAAEKLFIDIAALAAIEIGKSQPSLDLLRRMEKLYVVEIRHFDLEAEDE